MQNLCKKFKNLFEKFFCKSLKLEKSHKKSQNFPLNFSQLPSIRIFTFIAAHCNSLSSNVALHCVAARATANMKKFRLCNNFARSLYARCTALEYVSRIKVVEWSAAQELTAEGEREGKSMLRNSKKQARQKVQLRVL